MMSDKPRILIVDDERGCQISLRYVMDLDFEVVIASTAEEARQAFLDEPCPVVILDLTLPDGDGAKLLPWFKEQDPSVEIIISGAMAETRRDELTQLGARYVIGKPFDAMELREMARSCCSGG